jgi:hypothetical protein
VPSLIGFSADGILYQAYPNRSVERAWIDGVHQVPYELIFCEIGDADKARALGDRSLLVPRE